MYYNVCAQNVFAEDMLSYQKWSLIQARTPVQLIYLFISYASEVCTLFTSFVNYHVHGHTNRGSFRLQNQDLPYLATYVEAIIIKLQWLLFKTLLCWIIMTIFTVIDVNRFTTLKFHVKPETQPLLHYNVAYVSTTVQVKTVSRKLIIYLLPELHVMNMDNTSISKSIYLTTM